MHFDICGWSYYSGRSQRMAHDFSLPVKAFEQLEQIKIPVTCPLWLLPLSCYRNI